MSTQLFRANGSSIVLGNRIAKGGEGTVYAVSNDPTVVAKIYHAPLKPEKFEKLQAMSFLAKPELVAVAAWPVDMAYRSRGQEPVGVLMPYVQKHREIHQLYSPAQRKLHYPRADWSFLVHVARNCAAAFETVHAFGHVIGDVNQSGVLVADSATVRLIDCDSFQVRYNGRLFQCDVGVPQYTPPELSGKSFKEITRTEQHDCFGLALIIFHLLFMGRHPFSGRYAGREDMPIERAIKEGRFAFSQKAKLYGMMPPPYSLPLTALPSELANLFERAFAWPLITNGRPSAREWREAMEALKANLRTCLIDHGHKYPRHLSECPWCAIEQQGGPNFFFSVQVVHGNLYDLPRVDADELWKRIAAIGGPNLHEPDLTPKRSKYCPEALPEHLQDQKALLFVVRMVTLLTIIPIIVGLVVHELILYIGIGLALVFGIGWALLACTTAFKREFTRRKRQLSVLQHQFRIQRSLWEKTARQAEYEYNRLRSELASVRDSIKDLHRAFDRERSDLVAHRREAQLKLYLESKFLRDYSIPKIGPERRATLLSYGIETAADISWQSLQGIPGLGEKTIRRLIEWRRKMKAGFSFNRAEEIPKDRLRTLVMKYRQLQLRYENQLSNGANKLRSIVDDYNRQLAEAADRLTQLAEEVRQAEADARMKEVSQRLP